MTTDAILDELRKVCDERASPAEETDAVGGVPARYVASPASTEQTAELLRIASRHGLRVVARGGATKLDWGGPPSAVDVVVDTRLITGVVEHAAGDLVVIVSAGTPVDTLQTALAEAGQRLALDVSEHGATVGGAVATNSSGPRRLLYGTVRDLLIGVTFVRADGVVAKAGGKVVKNVAGYDFAKLLTGSHGTLGLLTQAVFRLHPIAPASRVVSVEVSDAGEAGRQVAAVAGSQVVATAVEVDAPHFGPMTVAVLIEGTDDGVARRETTAATLLGSTTADDKVPPWFGCYPFEPGGIGLKLTTEIAGLATMMLSVRRSADRHGVPVDVRGSGAGVVYAGLPATTAPADAAAVVADLRAAAPTYGGTVVVLTAPAAVRDVVDLWGPVAGLDLMRRLKDQLDPGHLLAPGRFVGGI